MKEVAIFNNRVQAEMWVGPLKEKGIPFVIQGEDCGGVRPELATAAGIKVLISKNDFNSVKEIYPEIDE